MATFTTPRGTKDILPDDWPYWDFVIGHAVQVAALYGFKRIETPTFGQTALFARSSGEDTDVGKEMYTFRDRDGDSLTLRPEGTAPVMRAYLQHGMHKLPQPVKLYYIERIYRREAPQSGRLREHHQFGCETIGVEDSAADVELIALLVDLYARLGLRDLTLLVNSIGDRKCRPRYIEDLVAYLRRHVEALPAKDRERLERNPLRVLDSKEPATRALLGGAPHLEDYLCEECRQHWEGVRHGLAVLGIAYTVDPYLVRGLDYYSRTVFEFLPPREGEQAVIGAGGRYDGLSEAIGGPHVPGVGFGSGIERLILNLTQQGAEVPPLPVPDVFVVYIGAQAEDPALQLAAELRRADVPAQIDLGGRSAGAQMKRAGASGARVALLLGEEELQQGTVTLRDLQSGAQHRAARGDVLPAVYEALARTGTG